MPWRLSGKRMRLSSNRETKAAPLLLLAALQQRTLTRGVGCQSELIQEQMLATVYRMESAVPVTHHEEVSWQPMDTAQLSVKHLSLYSSLQTAKHGIGSCFDAHAATMNNV